MPGQFFASSCFLRVSINSCRSDALFEPVQLGFETLDLLLDIFEFLGPYVSIVRDGNSLEEYLIMFDERVHPAKGRLERREPVSGLLHYVEENLCAIRGSLLLC